MNNATAVAFAWKAAVMDAYREQALAIMNGSGTHAGAA